MTQKKKDTEKGKAQLIAEELAQSRRDRMPEAVTLIIFGGSGDLTMRKLAPSLYQLYVNDRLPERFAIVGSARSEYEDNNYREKLLAKLEENLPEEDFFVTKARAFLKNVHYYRMDPEQEKEYAGFKSYLAEIDKEIDNPANYIFYLATPPSLYGVVPKCLEKVGLNNKGNADGKKKIRRIVIEKPFGYNLKSAKELNRIYKKAFHEKQLYRIDHFLGKETAQNIMALRFSNGIFEPLWNRNYIESVEITAVENLGIGTRGGFYDRTGALRDMVQNHLVQLLALTAMEPPAAFNDEMFRNEVVKIYESIRPLTKKEISEEVIRGQYTASKVKGKAVKGYRDEEKVDKDSRTETYVAMKLYVDNWRWGGVPFYIRTGKQMATKVTEIVVHFKRAPFKMFKTVDGNLSSNTLTIRIQPNEGTRLKFGMKTPGAGFVVQPVSMDFSYESLGGVLSGDAYARLIEDCMVGDPTLFTRSDAVEAAWRIFDPVIKAWESDDNNIPLYGYPAGSWGPKEAANILSWGEEWTNPCKNLTDTDLYCEL